MNVDVCIESADLKGALRTYIKRRLHFSLGRYGGKLGRIRVRVQDVPGAGELPDASCQIPSAGSPGRTRAAAGGGGPESVRCRRSRNGTDRPLVWTRAGVGSCIGLYS
jgi:hypothetical protein